MQVASARNDLIFNDSRKDIHGQNSNRQSHETRDVMYLLRTLFHNSMASRKLFVRFQIFMSHLLVFAFVAITFGVRLKKLLPRLMSRSLPPMFSLRSFILSRLMFRSSIHFELMFCLWCKIVIPFHSFVCSCLLYPAPFIKDIFLSQLYILISFAAC